jgi:hypothetical protein
MAIRNTRKRDSQQWILDYVVKEAGIEQNFEVGLRRYPRTVKSYRMIGKIVGEQARHAELIAREAENRGYLRSAEEMYSRAMELYRVGQHAIFEDDRPVKISLYAGLHA